MEVTEPILAIELQPVSDPCLDYTQNFEAMTYIRSNISKRIECAGKAFDCYYKFKESANSQENETAASEPLLEEEKEEKLFSGQWAQKRKKMSKEEIAKQSLFKDNYYEILGLESVGLNATDVDIKSAYRKLATLYHPDKVVGEDKVIEKTEVSKSEVSKEQAKVSHDIWMKIQKAYDILSSPDSRKQYDSSLPFDDTIPSDSEDINDDNFYETFGPVFRRNGQFSKIRPVPSLGDANTSIESVNRFYNFWDNFQSWRDFSIYDEYNLKESESRLEKRWMEKENKKIREKYVKEERARINRLERRKKEKQERKEREIKERALKELEYAKKKQEEIERANEELRKKKEAEQKRRALIQQKRKELQKLAKKIPEELFSLLEETELDPWLKKISEKTSEELHEMLLKRQEERILEEKKKQKREWTEEELKRLAKALKKIPGSVPNRWTQITEYVKTRSQKEVVAKGQEILKREELEELEKKMPKVAFEEYKKKMEALVPGLAPVEEAKVWTKDEQKALELALKKYPSTLPPNERWKKIAEEIPGKTKSAKDCLERVKEIKQRLAERKKQ